MHHRPQFRLATLLAPITIISFVLAAMFSRQLSHSWKESAMSFCAPVPVSAPILLLVLLTSLPLVTPATAEDAAPPESRIVRWDDAKSHTADWGEMRRYFGGETVATKDALVAVATVLPGKSVHEAHRHAQEEYLVVVEGTGTWWLNGKKQPAKRGDIMYAAPWDYHGLTNTGDSPLIFLVVRYNSKGVEPPPRPDDRPDELMVETDAESAQDKPLAKVAGLVTLNGQPLAGAAVRLVGEKGRTATGVTDENGRYKIKTDEENDGVAPGRYRVVITAPTPKQTAQPKGTLPAKYASPDVSGLMVEVVEGSNVFDLELAE
jgi:mannose-6-phosphate isomerase-like protein (cupin superfamily)